MLRCGRKYGLHCIQNDWACCIAAHDLEQRQRGGKMGPVWGVCQTHIRGSEQNWAHMDVGCSAEWDAERKPVLPFRERAGAAWGISQGLYGTHGCKLQPRQRAHQLFPLLRRGTWKCTPLLWLPECRLAHAREFWKIASCKVGRVHRHPEIIAGCLGPSAAVAAANRRFGSTWLIALCSSLQVKDKEQMASAGRYCKI